MARKKRFLAPFEVEIEALGPKGVGLGLAPDGKPVTVKGAAPGTRVLARVHGRKRGVWTARRVHTVRPAPDGQVPRCAIFDHCGGCTLQELGPDAQRRAKQALALRQIAQGMELELDALCEGVVVHPIREASSPWGYRNKVELSFGVRRYLSDADLKAGLPMDGRYLGFHAPGRFDKVVDATRCELVDDGGNQVIRTVREHALADSAPPPWDNRAHTGFWRHLVLRQGQATGQRMAVLVTASAEGFDGAEQVVGALAEALLGELEDGTAVVGVQWWVNDGVADVARGQVRGSWGAPGWTERLGAVTLELTPTAFFQTSTRGAEVLYDAVGEALGEGGGTLLDLYCGIGSIGLYLADRYERIEGVEEIEAAVVDARRNAVANGVAGRWKAAKVEHMLEALEGGAQIDIVVDPPRAGLHPKVARKLGQTVCRSMVYVACNPASLGRDAALMAEGWRLAELWPVDLFPQTGHVEVVGRFERVTP